MLEPALRSSLAARLEASRAALLATLEGVTERDFSVDLGGGETVVRALAALAAAEHTESAHALGEPVHDGSPTRPLPPQVIHALAGARYATRRYLDSPGAEAAEAEALVGRVVEREEAAAVRIRQRPRPEPPPAIPVVDR